MDAFRRTRGGVRARFDGPEAVLLRGLIEQVVDLLTDPDAGVPGVDAVQPGAQPAADTLAPGTPAVPSPAELEAMLGIGRPAAGAAGPGARPPAAGRLPG